MAGTERAPSARLTSGDWAVVAGLVLAGSVLAWLRLSPTTRATLWAEDGRNFLGGRLEDGPLLGWFDPYAGYLHVVPRAIADATVSLLPVDRYALGMSYLSCLASAAVAALVYVCSGDVVAWRPARLALGLTTILVPAASIEVLGNGANLHWYFLWLAPWLLLYQPRTTRGAVLLGLAGMAGALTEIQMVLFLPLALHRWRDPKRAVVWIGVAMGIVGQLIATVANPRTSAGGLTSVVNLVQGFIVNAVLGAWTGASGSVADLATGPGPVAMAAFAAPFVVAIAYGLSRGAPTERLAIVALVLGAGTIWLAACVVNRWPGLEYTSYTEEAWEDFSIIRYGVVPAMLLLGTLVVATAIHRRRGGRATPWVAMGALTVAFGLSFASPEALRDDGPTWADETEAATERCSAVGAPAVVEVPIAPTGWWVDVECDVLVP